MKIECDISNDKINSHKQLPKKIEEVVLRQFRDSIKKSVGSAVCPEHGLHPGVKFKARTFDKIEFEVSGCCQQIIDIVNAKLK